MPGKIKTTYDFVNEGRIINLPDGVDDQDAATVGQLKKGFTKILNGYSDTITQSEHLLVVVRGLRVCLVSTGEEVEVKETFNGSTVTIESNILFTNHRLTIY